jgi:hypothetical protein
VTHSDRSVIGIKADNILKTRATGKGKSEIRNYWSSLYELIKNPSETGPTTSEGTVEVASNGNHKFYHKNKLQSLITFQKSIKYLFAFEVQCMILVHVNSL